MRWEQLFADLQARAEAWEAAEVAAEVAERARIEAGSLTLVHRLRAAGSTVVSLQTRSGRFSGGVRAVGPDWVLVAASGHREVLVPLAAICAVSGLGRYAITPASDRPGRAAVEGGLGLRSALRAVARDRAAVRVDLTGGGAVSGTIDRVGADFLDLAVHPAGEVRRRSEVLDVHVIRLGAVGAVHRHAG